MRMTRQQLLEQITSYDPYNEQEEKDKKLILDFLMKNEDAFLRSNFLGHMTASCFIVNETMDKALFCYHKIYQSWSWLGGHADGDVDLLHVAVKEAKEEAGIDTVRPYSEEILSLESLCVNGHKKNGEYVSSHLHFNVTYLLVADDKEKLIINEKENSSLAWFGLDEILVRSSEPWFIKHIYPKLIEKVRMIKAKEST